MFSPSVSRPLTQVLPSSNGQNASYCATSLSPSASKAARSASVHQFAQRAGAVGLGALVVEPVADLVADHRADRRRS